MEFPKPKLCHLIKRGSFDNGSLGLNVRTTESGDEHFVGPVKPGSPADLSGLEIYDRIIEVNGVNISNENHTQVINRIRAQPDELKLLVLDLETDDYYRSKGIFIVAKADMASICTPVNNNNNNGCSSYGSISNGRPKPKSSTEGSGSGSSSTTNALDLNMTAKEMREKIKGQKKVDCRTKRINGWEKKRILETL